MPTLPEVLRAAETAHKQAQRRVSDADQEMKTVRAAAEAATTVSPELDARVTAAVKEKRAASDALIEAESAVKTLREVAAEEEEVQRAARDVHSTGVRGPGVDDDRPRALTRKQSMKDWARREGFLGSSSLVESDLSFDKVIRGIVTGNWRGAEQEQRAISESPLTAGGHLVPTPLALEVIDRARNKARTLQAGVTTVPMTSSTLKYPRLTTEASPAWRNEGATINDQAMTFDAVTLTARSMAMLVKVSWELLEDGHEVDGIIEDSFAAQIALELDRVTLRGSGTAPEPRGILNQTGVTLTSHGANGALIGTAAGEVNWDTLIDSQGVIRAQNFDPNATIWAPRSASSFGKLKDGQGQYLTPPTVLESLTRLATNQLPTNLTVGTSTDCSEVFTGQWNQCLLGIRSELTIQFLSERFADEGQVAFLAHMRGDVQLAQPSAFVVDLGVRS